MLNESEPIDLIKKGMALYVIDCAENQHPYKIPGDWVTYSEYNQGWADACDFIRSRIEPIQSFSISQWKKVME